MDAPTIAREHARHILELLPILRQWVTARVQQAGLTHDLSLRQYAALVGIRDGATSPGELARLWQVTPAVITGVVDRLERRGLLRREPDPVDRRRLRLALTPAGRQASDDIERALTDDLATQLATVSPDQLAALGRAVELLHRTFTALEARAPKPEPLSESDDMPLWSEEDEAENHRSLRSATRRPLVGAGQ